MIEDLIKEMFSLADSEQAKILQGFFKTGVGEYGEGDVFLGIKVPVQRKFAQKYSGLNFLSIQKLLNSKVHEHRLVGLLILLEKFKKGSETDKGTVFNLYLKNTHKINNWDLVDLTAPNIVGEFLFEKERKIIYDLARSKNLWEKRIAMISTFYFIRKEDFDDALMIAEMLLNDEHDLIHKAVGWMLREVGKKDVEVLEKFLKFHYKKMPRTMLRYAIEKFEEGKRKMYLRGEI